MALVGRNDFRFRVGNNFFHIKKTCFSWLATLYLFMFRLINPDVLSTQQWYRLLGKFLYKIWSAFGDVIKVCFWLISGKCWKNMAKKFKTRNKKGQAYGEARLEWQVSTVLPGLAKQLNFIAIKLSERDPFARRIWIKLLAEIGFRRASAKKEKNQIRKAKVKSG